MHFIMVRGFHHFYQPSRLVVSYLRTLIDPAIVLSIFTLSFISEMREILFLVIE
jgi:hypothetical protein